MALQVSLLSYWQSIGHGTYAHQVCTWDQIQAHLEISMFQAFPMGWMSLCATIVPVESHHDAMSHDSCCSRPLFRW